jgi:hypothetical protein
MSTDWSWGKFCNSFIMDELLDLRGEKRGSHREGGVGVRGISGWNPAKRKPNSPCFRLHEEGWFWGRLVPSQRRLGARLFAALMSAIVRRGRNIFRNRAAGAPDRGALVENSTAGSGSVGLERNLNCRTLNDPVSEARAHGCVLPGVQLSWFRSKARRSGFPSSGSGKGNCVSVSCCRTWFR